MKTTKYNFFVLLALIIVTGISANAEDLRKIVSLSGTWKFSIGDDSKWADPSYNDSEWDKITVPGQWENQGYNDYNGYAWYRKTFNMNEITSKSPIILRLGRIDDVDVVYLNGKEIGHSGKFPPEYKTAYDRTRKYIIPAEYLKDGDNTICVKVYDSYGEGGIVEGPAGIYQDTDNELLNVDLSGKWKFHTGNDKNWKTADFNDEGWTKINVPSVWENEGYEDYDGYAWYRLQFDLNENIPSGELFLVLGKIDDTDDVYLNGVLIGNVYDLRKHFFEIGDGWEYNARRIYKIKDGLLNRHGKNTIAVRVNDEHGLGGIYEGPIGIMSADNCKKYRNNHHKSDQTFWEYVYDEIFRNDNSDNE